MQKLYKLTPGHGNMLVRESAKQFKPGGSDHLHALEQVERYRMLVQGVQDYAIYLLDIDGNIMTWNNGARKLKGYNTEEVIGKNFSMFYPLPAQRQGVPERDLKTAIEYGTSEDSGWRIRKDGTRFWANVGLTALYEDGEVVGFAKVTRDLTERKLQEQRLVRANKELKEQRARLEELNTVKDEFVSMVSHQLRAPATGVKQYLGLLLAGYAGELTDQQREFIQHAHDSNERQLTMVDDLLHVAQVDSGKIVLDKRPVDLVAVVKDVITEHEDIFKARRQNVIFAETSEPSLIVPADSMRIRMVIENLIDNASKYTPKQGTITIAAEQGTQNVQLHIADTGVGIPEAEQAQLFKKFSRIHNNLTDRVQGSGLGLYWAKKVVSLHRGSVTVISSEGQGSTFTIVLPR